MSSDTQIESNINQLKNQLLNIAIYSVVAFALPGLIFLSGRLYDAGYYCILMTQCLAYVIFILIAAFSKFIPFNFRLITTLATWTIVGLTAMTDWWLIPFGLPVLISAALFGTLLIHSRFGFFMLGLTLMIILLMRIGIYYQWLFYPENLKDILSINFVWAIMISLTVVLGGLMVYSIGKLQTIYFEAILACDCQKETLQTSETRLKLSEQQYTQLFHNMLDAFAVHELIVDENNNPKDYRFLLVNPAFESMTAHKREDLIGKTVLEILPDIESYWLDMYRKVALSEGPIQFENYAKTLNRYLEVCAYCPTPGQVACIFRDISRRKIAESEQKDLENQLRQSHKMEALGTLSGGVAHDFNNMLMPIMGYTEMLIDDHEENPETKSSLNEILKAASRAKKLAEQILTFSRRSKMQFLAIDVVKIIEETIPLLRASIPTSIELRQDIENINYQIMGDATQFQQIILNLCTNAFHAMDKDNGWISISLHAKQINELSLWNGENLPAGRYLRLSIADNGHGIDSETQERIFDPYFTTKEKGKGTGLGLSMVLGIVNRFNGGILLQSTPSEGTRFDIFLPLVDLAEMAQTANNNTPIETGAERILLVDDEDAILDIEKKLLLRLGYAVTASNSSLDALALFEKSPDDFDLVVSDLTMPKMSGDQLADAIKEIRPDVPVIICTGYSQEKTDMLKNSTINATLTKPVLKKELARAVRQVLDGTT